MNLTSVIKNFKEWLSERNFVQTRNKKIFIKDQRFYLIIVEIQPFYKIGFFLNVGVKFLWSSSTYMSYDYTIGDSRIYSNTNVDETLGAILFDSCSFEKELCYIKNEADKRIQEYQKLTDFLYLEECLVNRNDFTKRANRGYSKRDMDLASVKIIIGNLIGVDEIINNAKNRHSVAKMLFPICDDLKSMRITLNKLVNDIRKNMSEEYKIQLINIELFDE